MTELDLSVAEFLLMGLFLAKVFGNMNESEPKVLIFLVKKLFFVEESFEVFLFFFDLL